MKLKVKYTIIGEYELDSRDLDIEGCDEMTSEELLEACTDVINEEPLLDVDPLDDGKLTVKVEEAV